MSKAIYLNKLPMPQIIAAMMAIKIQEPMAIAMSPPIYPKKLSELNISLPLLSTNT